MREKDLPIDLAKHKVYSRSAKKVCAETSASL